MSAARCFDARLFGEGREGENGARVNADEDDMRACAPAQSDPQRARYSGLRVVQLAVGLTVLSRSVIIGMDVPGAAVGTARRATRSRAHRKDNGLW
jgi:hypothetical protein